MKTTASHSTTHRILQVLGVFGGVQVVSMLCGVIRNKLAAIWLGPAGVGLMAVYNSTMTLVTQAAQMSLDQSSIRDLANKRDDALAGAYTVAVVRKLSLAFGIGGMAATLLFAPLLSMYAFGNISRALAFVLLSAWVFLAIVTNGELAILRGYDMLKKVAKASLCSALVAVALSVPLLYFFRLGAIVPVFLVYYAVTCAFALLFRNRSVPRVRVSLRQAWHAGGPMLKLGAYMTVSIVIALLASNIFVIYLNRNYGDDTVGCYQAGYTMINTYVGIVFSAIAMEFYPRLSRVIERRRFTEVLVSHEIVVAQFVLLPVAVAFVACAGLALKILYSDAFEAALPYVAIGACGVFFRATSWCLAYSILAKGDGRIYVLTEAASAVIYLILHIVLYDHFGFTGLGVAYVLWYAIYLTIVYIVYSKRYKLRLRPAAMRLTMAFFVIAVLAVGASVYVNQWLVLAAMLPAAAFAAYRRLR